MDIRTKDGIVLRGIPDGTPEEQIKERIYKIRSERGIEKPPAEVQQMSFDPTDGMSTTDKFLAGAGKGMVDLARGAGQLVGIVSDKEVEQSKQLDKPLMNTTAGTVGNAVGTAAALAPAMLIPGANTYTGAALIGGISGALQPVGEGDSRIVNAGVGTIGGLAGQKAGNMLANSVVSNVSNAATRKAENAVRDQVIATAKNKGLVVAPSSTDAGLGTRLLEGMSGQIKTQQKASLKNQPMIDNLVKQDLGIPENVPITKGVLKDIRKAAGTAYDEVAKTGEIVLGGSNPLPAAVKGVKRGNSALGTGSSSQQYSIGADDVVENLKQFRRDGNAYMKAYMRDANPETLAKAKSNLSAAEKLESLLDSHVSSIGKPELLSNLKASRQMIAKTYTAQSALKGSNVNSAKLTKALESEVPLSGNMRMIAELGQYAPKSVQVPKEGFGAPLSALDFMLTGGIGYGAGPSALLLPAARVGAREAILSKPYQQMFVNPQYGSSLARVATKEIPLLGNSISDLLPYAGLLGGAGTAAQY